MKIHLSNLKKNNASGFTLIELLLYFALVSLLFIQLTSLFITVLEAKQDSHATSAVERDGQFILARLTYDIQRADAVVTPAALGEQSGQLQLTIDGSTYIYSITDTQLVLTRSGETIILSSNIQVSNFTVRRLGNVGGKHTLQISFTAISPIQEVAGQESRIYQTTIGLR
jgi:type II secretory pathway component PulJ